jgi:hypothetical protein
MGKEFAKQVDNKPKRDEKGRLLPGGTANPSGRPAGSVSLLNILKNKLAEVHPDQKRAYGELLIESMLDDALMLDGPSRKLVLQYIEGLPAQKIDLQHSIKPIPLDDVRKNNSIQQNKEDEEEDKSITGGNSSIEDSFDSTVSDSTSTD